MTAKIWLHFYGRSDMHLDGNMGGSFLVGSAPEQLPLNRFALADE